MSHCAHDLTLEARGHQAEEDTNRAHTTVGFPVVQLNTVQKQFVATRKVPVAVHGKQFQVALLQTFGAKRSLPNWT